MASPTLTNYRAVKAQYPDYVLLWRMGDFYEALEADAKLFSEACDVALVSRVVLGNERVAMAGVPYHSVERYIRKLVDAGHKVALADPSIVDPGVAHVRMVVVSDQV